MVNLLLLQELAGALLTNEVLAVKYQVAVAVYCTWISLAFNSFPDSVVD